jgi:hypothetical protein
MDDNLRIFGWVLASGGFGALLGGAFGCLSGATYWRSGRTAGTAFGLEVARSFNRAADGRLTRGQQGAIVGTADGVLFLGVVGTVVGACYAYSGRASAAALGPVALAALLLVGAAAFFGLLAYAIVRAGLWAVVWLFPCGILGALLGIREAGILGMLGGMVAGLFAGTVVALWTRRHAPEIVLPRLSRRPATEIRDPADDRVTDRPDPPQGFVLPDEE